MEILPYAGSLLLGVFLASIAQAMLKYAARRRQGSWFRMYWNPWVIGAYIILFGTTFLAIYAYRGIPLSMGAVLESTSYIYVTFWGYRLFHEKVNRRKILALCLIVSGIAVFSLWG
ncbi:MAG: EamA family transporter [Selenomonadaceae bacterium]|nr:EamA family transporter [Selenomonadaceae bacterium]